MKSYRVCNYSIVLISLLILCLLFLFESITFSGKTVSKVIKLKEVQS
jgi:inner membrane protein involved in colicin E2 resistance